MSAPDADALVAGVLSNAATGHEEAVHALRARCRATHGQIARDDITGAIKELQACLVVAQELGDRESESKIQRLLPQTQQLLQLQRGTGIGDVSTYPAGTVVQVAGLKSQKAVGMNGQLAVIEGFSTATGRYIVRLNGWSKTVALKPENCIADSG